MARRSRLPGSPSPRPPARHNDPTGVSRRVRRSRVRHHSLFTRKTVWLHWRDLPINENGIALRVERIAERRGKSLAWARKRLAKDLKRFRTYQQEQTAKMQEILEQMQKQMLPEQEHDHESTTSADQSGTENPDGKQS